MVAISMKGSQEVLLHMTVHACYMINDQDMWQSAWLSIQSAKLTVTLVHFHKMNHCEHAWQNSLIKAPSYCVYGVAYIWCPIELMAIPKRNACLQLKYNLAAAILCMCMLYCPCACIQITCVPSSALQSWPGFFQSPECLSTFPHTLSLFICWHSIYWTIWMSFVGQCGQCTSPVLHMCMCRFLELHRKCVL